MREFFYFSPGSLHTKKAISSDIRKGPDWIHIKPCEIAHPVCRSYFAHIFPLHHTWSRSIIELLKFPTAFSVQKTARRARPDAPLWLSLTVKLIERSAAESKKTQKSLNAAHLLFSKESATVRGELIDCPWPMRDRFLRLMAPLDAPPLWQLDTQGHAYLSSAAVRVKRCSRRRWVAHPEKVVRRYRLMVIYFYCRLIWITNWRAESHIHWMKALIDELSRLMVSTHPNCGSLL